MLVSCGLLVGLAGATSCPLLIEWNGVRYDGGNFEQRVAFGAPAGEAIVPPCGEEGAGCRAAEGDEVRVFRLPGVDPHVAVGARSPFGREVYLAAGFFPELPDHPLHEAAYGSARRPNERRGWRCDEPIAGVVGTATLTPGWGWVFAVRFEGDQVRRHQGRTVLFVDVQTTITGFDEYGLPRIVEGDRIRATVRECTSGQRYKVVADTISNARR